MSYLLYEKVDRKGIITLNRPEKRNALHPDLISELSQVLEEAHGDPLVKVLVLKSSGRAFCAGADLEYLQKMQAYSNEENLVDSRKLSSCFLQLYDFPKPTIAQVSGHAVAGGAGIVSVCDFAFMSREAKIGYSEVRIGFIPAIVSPFLIRKIGQGRALEMMLSGSLYSAQEACQWGLATEVVEPGHLESRVSSFADELVRSNASEAMEMTKKWIHQISDTTLPDDLDRAARLNAQARGTDSCKRGIQSFLEKSQTEW